MSKVTTLYLVLLNSKTLNHSSCSIHPFEILTLALQNISRINHFSHTPLLSFWYMPPMCFTWNNEIASTWPPRFHCGSLTVYFQHTNRSDVKRKISSLINGFLVEGDISPHVRLCSPSHGRGSRPPCSLALFWLCTCFVHLPRSRERRAGVTVSPFWV